MKKIRLIFLICLVALLSGPIPSGPAAAFDGNDGGDDGGYDGGDDGGYDGGDDGGEDQGAGGNHDGEDHHDKDGHHGQGHPGESHHSHAGNRPHGPGGPGGYGVGPGFGPGFGFGGFGGFGYIPPYYPVPYAHAYPLVVQPVAPSVYIQQQKTVQSGPRPEMNYWHYCRASEDYYPQVKECPDGWVQVPPQAQNDSQQE